MKKALTLPENEFPAWVKVGAMSVPSVFQYPFYLLQGFFRLRHDMQRVGHDHYIKGLVRIGQAEHILHGEVQLGRAVIPLRLGDHLRRGVRRLDVCRRVHDVFAINPVPVASSSTVLTFTFGRISSYISSYARPILFA